jgi:hypothetical protein
MRRALQPVEPSETSTVIARNARHLRCQTSAGDIVGFVAISPSFMPATVLHGAVTQSQYRRNRRLRLGRAVRSCVIQGLSSAGAVDHDEQRRPVPGISAIVSDPVNQRLTVASGSQTSGGWTRDTGSGFLSRALNASPDALMAYDVPGNRDQRSFRLSIFIGVLSGLE